MSCKTLLNYAVSFTQVESTTTASVSFLRELGVVCSPNSQTIVSVSINTASGTDAIPAELEVIGEIPIGYTASVEVTSEFQLDPFVVEYTSTQTQTADEFATSWAELINEVEQVTATANGSVIEILALAPAVTVSIANAILLIPSIVQVTDPDDLELLTDQHRDIQAVFDGGLNSVYLIITDDALEIPAIITDQECTFFTIYGSKSFTPAEYLIAFAGWQGVQAFTTHQNSFITDNANQDNTCLFFENTGSYSTARCYYGLFAFGSLLSSNAWRNQQYISITEANGSPVDDEGEADTLFDDRGSFYLTDDEQGTRLAFFVAGGKSITTPYINREVQVFMQSDMLSYLSANQPYNIETSRRRLEQIGGNVLTDYLDDGLLDPDGDNFITITTSNEQFIVNGELTTAEAVALWRVRIDAINYAV